MENNRKILVVADSEKLLDSLIGLGLFKGLEFYWASHFEESDHLLKRHNFLLVFLHLEKKIMSKNLSRVCNLMSPGGKTIVVSDLESPEFVEKMYRLGAKHYFLSHHFFQNLKTIGSGIIHDLNSEANQKRLGKFFHTQNPQYLQQLERALSVHGRFSGEILITGPTGVGKTLLAKEIHRENFQGKPFVNINLNERPEHLIESELFGHVKGAFTGAQKNREGILAQANGGLLFIDEIGTLSVSLQRKLLKVLEEKVYIPIGKDQPVKADFKLVSATCDNLEEMVVNGKMREDFYYRIKGLEIEIPGLNKRPEDIPLLLKHFVSQQVRQIYLTPPSVEVLQRWQWRGNVRELKKFVEQLSCSEHTLVTPIDLPTPKKWISKRKERQFLNLSAGLNELVAKVEKQAFQQSFQKHQGRVNKIVRELKISKSHFYRLKRQYGEKVQELGPPLQVAF